MNIDLKILKKILAIWVQQYIISIIHYGQKWVLWRMQGCFQIWPSFNLLNHIYRLKKKNQMIISIGAEKLFDNPTPILTKALENTRNLVASQSVGKDWMFCPQDQEWGKVVPSHHFVQYWTGSSHQGNQVSRRNKRYAYWKGRGKIVWILK